MLDNRCIIYCRSKEAQEQYETALKYDAENPDLYFNVTYLFICVFVYFNLREKLSLASPLWIDLMSMGNGYGHGCVRQDATLSQGQPHDVPYITTVLTQTLPITLSLSITYNYRPVSHYYGQLATTE